MRPWAVFHLIHKITEPIPGEFTMGYGAAEGDFAIRDADDLPVSAPGTIFDINLLSYLKRV